MVAAKHCSFLQLPRLQPAIRRRKRLFLRALLARSLQIGGFSGSFVLLSTMDHLPLDLTYYVPLSTTLDHILRLNSCLSRAIFEVVSGKQLWMRQDRKST